MDPVTAFGLAGTVATFIDFGTKFAKLTWSIYHDEDSPNPASELSKLVGQFEQVVKDINLPSCYRVNASEDNLNQLANECKEFSAKVVKRLRKGGLLDRKPNSKKAAFISAVRLCFRRGDLDRLKNELEGLRDRFSFLLLISLRSLAQRNLEAQDEIVQALKLSNKKNHEFQNNMQLILSDLASKDDLEDDIARQVMRDESLVQASGAHGIILSKKSLEDYSAIFIKSLVYTGMHDRQKQVPISFKTTFDWALKDEPYSDQKWAHLPTWLASDNQIYWISGKAGSGKSTFMKYLCPDHLSARRCHPFLSNWAKQRDLVIASFYFWAADSEKLQKSQEGLFRSLLYQIFKSKPALISHAFPRQWEILVMTGQGPQLWSESELRAGIIRVIASLPAHNSCICLFIDGLDEFGGQPSVLIDLVQALTSQGDHIKLCLASRPWVEFGDAFKQKPQLLLEDLTYDDIKLFVTRKFDDHHGFNSLKVCQPDFADQLVENIVSKGQGVFLWIVLVVGSLLSGISFGDRVEDLEHRLALLPPDLEDLYERLINGLDPFYHEHRVQLMILVEKTHKALSVTELYFADGGTMETLKLLSSASASEDAWEQQVDMMRRRLNSRWRGLLELSPGTWPGLSPELFPDPSPRVRFLHRTVSDFIKGPRMRAFIQQHKKADFDPHFQLCIGICAHSFLYRDSSYLDATSVEQHAHVHSCMQHACKVHKHNEVGMKQILDHLYANNHTELNKDRARQLLLKFAIWSGATAYMLPTLGEISPSVSINSLLQMAFNSSILSTEIVRALLARIPTESKDWSDWVDRVLSRLRDSSDSDAHELCEELRSMKSNHKRCNENVSPTDRPVKKQSRRRRKE